MDFNDNKTGVEMQGTVYLDSFEEETLDKVSFIKRFMVEIDRKGLLQIKIPNQYAEDLNSFLPTVKKLDEFTENDVIVDSMKYENGNYHYIITIADILTLGLIEKSEDEISYVQLELKEV